jgi:hypothetical protein
MLWRRLVAIDRTLEVALPPFFAVGAAYGALKRGGVYLRPANNFAISPNTWVDAVRYTC